MRRRMLLSRRVNAMVNTLFAGVFIYALHMTIQTYTLGGRARDIVEWEAGHWAVGVTTQPAKPGEAGYLEPWYRTPNAEDATVVLRIYGADALPHMAPATPPPVLEPLDM